MPALVERLWWWAPRLPRLIRRIAKLPAENRRLGRQVEALAADMASQEAKFQSRIGFLEAYQRSLQYGHDRMWWRARVLAEELFGPPNPTVSPPREIPPELMGRFTMNGLVEIEYNYLDCTYPDNHPLVYTDAEIDHYIERIKTKNNYVYGTLDEWVNAAMGIYPVRGLDVVNMGSLTPWYEAMILLNGGRPVTVDYNRIITRTKRVTTMTAAEHEGDGRSFDYGLSISSFEHDGLGMYGDPLDPDGDLKAMRKMQRMLKPGAILLLAVPTGKDKILFNNARIYGKHRLPKLMDGWDWIDSWGYSDSDLDGNGSAQPLYVLRNRRP